MVSLASVIIALLVSSCSAVIQLEPYNVDPASVTVSGISAGAAMATQLHVIHSSMIHGAAFFAGVPYHCALGILAEALLCMDTPGLVSVNNLITDTEDYAAAGKIDSTANLVGDPVFVFAGTLDTVVRPGNGDNLVQYYEHFGSTIETEFTVEAEHCQPTNIYGPACSFLGGEYINNCQYDGALAALNALYDHDIHPGFENETIPGIFEEFDQTVFFDSGNPAAESMDDVGYIYIPSKCVDKTVTCRLHVVFHGCLMGRYVLGDTFVRNTGYLEIAEINSIIMLFPQAVSKSIPYNPNGCFDWWGYTGALKYATNEGTQIIALRSMIETLLGTTNII